MRREIEILRRREAIRETELAGLLAEVEQARRIQQQVGCGPLPVIRGAALCAYTNAAGPISGDAHRARRLGDSAVALFVADSTGHGLAASLLSTTIIGAMYSPLRSAAPDCVLERLNLQLLSYALVDCEFVTAVCAEYDETTRVFRWSRAGAPPPVLLRGGVGAQRLDSAGLALGIDAQAGYCCREIQLQPGDTILLHTDGLEALHARCTNTRDERAFLGWVGRLCECGLTASLDGLAAQSGASRMPAHRDDITLLSLHVTE